MCRPFERAAVDGVKQAIVINAGLKMGKGKTAAQASHASLDAALSAPKASVEEWRSGGMEKVVLKVADEWELLELHALAKRRKLPCSLIRDAGRTQIPAGSITALAIGPAAEKEIDEITGHLKLL